MPIPSPEPSKRPLGFTCPDCKIELSVVRTRKAACGVVRRVRECEICGHIQPTEERPKTPATGPTCK